CRDAAPGKCPAILYILKQCTSALPPNRPPGTSIAESTPLGFFKMKPIHPPPSPTGSVCDSLRKVRADSKQWEEEHAKFVNPLNPWNLAEIAPRISYNMRYGGYSDVTVDNLVRYTTGDLFNGGPASTGWPCVAKPPTVNCDGGAGLFCDTSNCES